MNCDGTRSATMNRQQCFYPRLTDTVLAAARPAVMTLAKQHRSTPIPKQPGRHPSSTFPEQELQSSGQRLQLTEEHRKS